MINRQYNFDYRKDLLAYFSSQTNNNLSNSITIGEGLPELVVFGAIHGNEPAGIEAIINYHKHLKSIALPKGKVTFVVGNPDAYKLDQRYIDADLNRSFGDQIDSSLIERRRATEIYNYLQANRKSIKAVLDLHSLSKGNFKMAVYSAENARNKEFIQQISPLELQFAFHKQHLEGLLIDVATSLGLDALGVECGNHTSSDAVETAIVHIDRLLHFYGLISSEQFLVKGCNTMKEAKRVYETIKAIRPGKQFRFLNLEIQSEYFLRKGEEFATDETGVHIAPQDCYVMMPSKIVKPTDSDAGFLCVRK